MDDLVRQKSHQGLMELHSVSEAPSIKEKTVFINFEFQLFCLCLQLSVVMATN